MSDTEKLVQEARERKNLALAYRWSNEPGVMLIKDQDVYQLILDRSTLCDALEEREREVERLREALEAVVYDTDMKRNRWSLWTKARKALAAREPREE